MAQMTETLAPPAIQHPGENASNDIRRRLAAVEPHAIRTFTPSMAVLARSSGSYHWTPEGRKLADFTSGVLVMNLGHNPAGWWRRVTELLQIGTPGDTKEFCQGVTLNAYNALTEVELLATEKLLNLMRGQPGGARCEQVLWAASGSEAIQKALWASMDRREGENMILSTRYGFHGKKGLAGAVTGSERDPERDPRVRFIAFPREECADLEHRRQPLDLTAYETELERAWDELGSKICCLITEPYLGGGGSYHPQKEYLQLLERFCREHDIVFILDEVQANFGRTGSLFAFTEYGVEPDIVVLGKGLGNGVPVSAAVGRADLFANMKYGEASDTWSANPLASAAVLATLEEYASGKVMEQAQKLSRVLEAGLVRLQSLDTVAQVRGEGVVWGIECAPVGQASAGEVARACVEQCYRGDSAGRAIHLLGPLADKVIRISPPLVMPLAEAQEYLDAMYGIFADVGRRFAGA
ncbi:MAG TPA: aspartate aminotransferase family protein [Pirellulales bacterium]|jgi:4-aminobutyrate aminotransferase-like enzyme|nr:aspartate aminotransferase family protein [Pirellulales bacterium]